jgi:hypothetical protein
MLEKLHSQYLQVDEFSLNCSYLQTDAKMLLDFRALPLAFRLSLLMTIPKSETILKWNMLSSFFYQTLQLFSEIEIEM